MAVQKPETRVGARRHPQPRQEPRAGLGSGSEADADLGLGEAVGPACVGGEQVRERFGEGLAGGTRRWRSGGGGRTSGGDGAFADREVGWGADVGAVEVARPPSALGAGGAACGAMSGEQEPGLGRLRVVEAAAGDREGDGRGGHRVGRLMSLLKRRP